jgi:hypothetical protein
MFNGPDQSRSKPPGLLHVFGRKALCLHSSESTKAVETPSAGSTASPPSSWYSRRLRRANFELPTSTTIDGVGETVGLGTSYSGVRSTRHRKFDSSLTEFARDHKQLQRSLPREWPSSGVRTHHPSQFFLPSWPCLLLSCARRSLSRYARC